MKLLNVHIRNFKSLKKVDVELNDEVSLLIGKNNSGKSNFIEALLYLPRIIKGDLREEEFEKITYDKNISNELRYELTFSLSEDEKSKFISGFDIADEQKKEIDKFLESRIKYIGVFKKGKRILVETIYLYYMNEEVKFSEGIWERDLYNYSIMRNINRVMSPDIRKHNLTNLTSTRLSRVSRPGDLPISILLFPRHGPEIYHEEYLLTLIMDFLENIYHMGPNRFSYEIKTLKGDFKLRADGENLPEVLHSLAASNRRCFDRITKHTTEMIESILEIKTPIIEGEQRVYIALEERYFEDIEFTWDNISSGTKEVIFLVTLLDSSKKGCLLLIEEPEIHLHGDAIRRFISILKDVIKADDKQVIITTHAPAFVDLLNQENLLCVLKEEGSTNIISLSHEINIEETLIKAGLSKSDLFISKIPSFLLIVEGRDDVRIFDEFLSKEGIDSRERKINIVKSSEEGGTIKFGKMLKKTRTGIPFLLVKDSDGKKDKKIQEMKGEGFRDEEYLILEKREIEDYLIDSDAIAKMSHRSSDEVRRLVSQTRGTGKEKLEKILAELKISSESGIKALIARHMEITPPEIKERITFIKTKILNINDNY